MKKIYIALVIFCFGMTYAQIPKDKDKVVTLLEESKKAYENTKAYSLSLRSVVYKDFDTQEVLEESQGVFIKYGQENYLKMSNGEAANLETVTVKTDGDSKLIQIGKKNKQAELIYDLSGIVKNYSSFQVVETSKEWICTLEAEKIASTPYGKIKIYIDKKTKYINRQILYLYAAIPKSGKDYYPRIEMIFTDFTFLKERPKQLELSHYVKKVNLKYTPSLYYAGYQIID
ncbi:hypothetical protein [Flavobacterium sediminis]|nr:hypothetical protein [Flavobacterium sediminis]